jgi:hypothetical protein
MILEVSPDSSLLVRGAAATILYMHIAGGMLGIVAGAAALSMPKGGRPHRIVGNVFFVSMMIMAAIGAVVSPFLPKPDWVNVVAGAFTFYLVATAWMTVKRTSIGSPEKIAFVWAVVTATSGIAIGTLGKEYTHLFGDGPFLAALIFGSIAALAAIGDFKLIRQNGISGRPRVSRHLWRMCLAFWIAVGSLFGGQPQLFPEAVQESGMLFVPVLAALIAMIGWMLRVRFARRWQAAAYSRAS